MLNQLAGTSMTQYMRYLEAAEGFHERLRLFFYPKVFEKQHADTIDWSTFTLVFYAEKVPLTPFKRCLPLVVSILFVGVLTIPITRTI